MKSQREISKKIKLLEELKKQETNPITKEILRSRIETLKWVLKDG